MFTKYINSLLLIAVLSTCSYSLSSVNYYWNVRVAGDSATTKKLRYNYDSLKLWTTATADTLNRKFLRYTPGSLTHDSTMKYLKIDTLIANKPISSPDFYSSGGVYTDITSVCAFVGFSSFTSKKILRKKIGKTVFIQMDVTGVSEDTDCIIVFPDTSNTNAITSTIVGLGLGQDSTLASIVCPMYLYNNSVAVAHGLTGTAWQSSGRKSIQASFFYETN